MKWWASLYLIANHVITCVIVLLLEIWILLLSKGNLNFVWVVWVSVGYLCVLPWRFFLPKIDSPNSQAWCCSCPNSVIPGSVCLVLLFSLAYLFIFLNIPTKHIDFGKRNTTKEITFSVLSSKYMVISNCTNISCHELNSRSCSNISRWLVWYNINMGQHIITRYGSV